MLTVLGVGVGVLISGLLVTQTALLRACPLDDEPSLAAVVSLVFLAVFSFLILADGVLSFFALRGVVLSGAASG